MHRRDSFGLLILVSLLCMAWMAGIGLAPIAIAVAQESPLPTPDSPLPLPRPPSSDGNAPESVKWGFVVDGAIELPSPALAGKIAMRIKTQQINVGWWDVCGRLGLAPAIDGYVDIPADAVEVSIPGDVTGRFSLADWTKTQRADGEWVLRRNKITQRCTPT